MKDQTREKRGTKTDISLSSVDVVSETGQLNISGLNLLKYNVRSLNLII